MTPTTCVYVKAAENWKEQNLLLQTFFQTKKLLPDIMAKWRKLHNSQVQRDTVAAIVSDSKKRCHFSIAAYKFCGMLLQAQIN